MKITYNNQNIKETSFKSKNIDIKKADDVMRHAKKCFPAFSPSYAGRFYKTLNGSTQRKDSTDFYNKTNGILGQKIRKKCENQEKLTIDYILNLVQQNKLANCFKQSCMVFAALLVNNFFDTMKVTLGLEVLFVDKTNKEKVYREESELDHSVVITNMNNQDRFYVKDLVVIDPWIQKAQSKSEACGNYQVIFHDEICQKTADAQKNFRRIKEIKNEPYNKDDYETRMNFYFYEKLKIPKNEEKRKALQEKMHEIFPELKLESRE